MIIGPAPHAVTIDGLAGSFDVIVISDEIGREFRKPHPAPFLAALDALWIPPADAIHIGDRPEKDGLGRTGSGCGPSGCAPASTPRHRMGCRPISRLTRPRARSRLSRPVLSRPPGRHAERPVQIRSGIVFPAVVVTGLLVATATPAQASGPDYAQIIQDEAAFVAAAQLTSATVQSDLKAIAGAVLATQGSDGLTSALSSQQPFGQYTEDNIEAAQGWADYAALLTSEGEPSAAHWATAASSIRSGVASYEWLASAGAYRDAADQASASFTPCTAGTIQLWVASDLQGTPQWRQSVITSYASGDPGWLATTPGYPDISCTDGHDPESATAYAAAQTGDAGGANSWLDSSQVNWVDAGRPYPWTVQDSGFRALTAYVLNSGTPYLP